MRDNAEKRKAVVVQTRTVMTGAPFEHLVR